MVRVRLALLYALFLLFVWMPASVSGQEPLPTVESDDPRTFPVEAAPVERADMAMLAVEPTTALPVGFSDELVSTVFRPTAMAFTPDGRLLITTQTGRLRVYQNGALLPTPALNLNPILCHNSERGLLGVAVDPNFASNRFIYLFYTFRKHGVCEQNTALAPVNRVSRFVLPDNNIVDPTSEKVLLNNLRSPGGNHNGGDLHFGKNNLLYISVGDGGCDYVEPSLCAAANDAARDAHVLLGKVLRITRHGGIPSTNPYRGSDSARCNKSGQTTPGLKCQEIFATGLRNPFRMAFNPNAAGTQFFINDVGQSAWEEINRGQVGADYGWNIREGRCVTGSTTDCGPAPAGLSNPQYSYGHGSGCRSITGGAFVPNGAWPAEYDDSYLFADYICGKIFRRYPTGAGGYAVAEFATGLGAASAVHLTFGPHQGAQALYYTTFAGGGQIRRIWYTGAVAQESPAE